MYFPTLYHQYIGDALNYIYNVCMCAQSMSDSFLTPWIVAHQAPLQGFFRQEYWNGLPLTPPGDLPYPEIEPTSLVSCIGRWILYHCGPWEAYIHNGYLIIVFLTATTITNKQKDPQLLRVLYLWSIDPWIGFGRSMNLPLWQCRQKTHLCIYWGTGAENAWLTEEKYQRVRLF